jgi:signal transduction histidine kinase
MNLGLQSVKPGVLARVLMAMTLVIFVASLAVVDRVGEAIITKHRRLGTEAVRDFFVAFAREEGLSALVGALDRETMEQTGVFRYTLFDADGHRIRGIPLLTAEQLPAPGFTIMPLKFGRQVQAFDVLVQPMQPSGTLVIYRNLSEQNEFRLAIVGAAGAALLVSVILVAATSLGFGRLLVQRAKGIALVAERMSRGDLSARVPVGTAGDVFDNLGVSINAMLDRIDELLTGLQTVTDSLAHDLRSPLARLRGALSRALDQNTSESERLSLIEQALKGLEEVLAIFGALLDIARAETGLSREMMAAVDLTALVANLGELFEPVMEDSAQKFTVYAPDHPCVAKVHELILRQALGNLLHNATRYAGAGAQITLSLEERDRLVRFTVADSGPGIPAQDRGRVQERFIRLDSARGTKGSGLGLAIVAACAKLHGGQLSLQDNQPGLKVVLEFPAMQVSGAPATLPAGQG